MLLIFLTTKNLGRISALRHSHFFFCPDWPPSKLTRDTREWSCLWKAIGQIGHKLTGHLLERSRWPKLSQPLKLDSKRNWNFFLHNVAWIQDIFQSPGPLTFTLNGTVTRQGQVLVWQGGHTDFEPRSFSHRRRCKSCVDLDEPLCQSIVLGSINWPCLCEEGWGCMVIRRNPMRRKWELKGMNLNGGYFVCLEENRPSFWRGTFLCLDSRRLKTKSQI